MNGGGNIYEAARNEWQKHICNILVPVIEEGFRNIYTNCVMGAQRAPEGEDFDGDDDEISESVITAFQQTLRNIPRWSPEIVDIEYNRILDHDQDTRDVLDDLIKAAFTSHVLVLAQGKKLDIPIPDTKRYIHKVYIEAAREFYRSPFLFFAGGEYRQHKNNARIDQVLCHSISEYIIKMMPIKMVLQSFAAHGNEPIDEDVAGEVEDIWNKYLSVPSYTDGNEVARNAAVRVLHNNFVTVSLQGQVIE